MDKQRTDSVDEPSNSNIRKKRNSRKTKGCEWSSRRCGGWWQQWQQSEQGSDSNWASGSTRSQEQHLRSLSRSPGTAKILRRTLNMWDTPVWRSRGPAPGTRTWSIQVFRWHAPSWAIGVPSRVTMHSHIKWGRASSMWVTYRKRRLVNALYLLTTASLKALIKC